MQFMFVVVAVELEAMGQLVGGVRFAQAAEAAQSVQSKPPEAAMGRTGSDSDRFQRPENLAEVRSPHQPVEVLGIRFAMILLFRSGSPAAVVRTGPAGTQRLRCRCAGSGVGAQYAPTPLTSSRLAWSAHKATRAHSCSASQANAAKAPTQRQHVSGQRGLTTRSSGAPTAGHQARPQGTGVHFPVAGPGVLPSSPA